jgi:hypothetical protein
MTNAWTSPPRRPTSRVVVPVHRATRSSTASRTNAVSIARQGDLVRREYRQPVAALAGAGKQCGRHRTGTQPGDPAGDVETISGGHDAEQCGCGERPWGSWRAGSCALRGRLAWLFCRRSRGQNGSAAPRIQRDWQPDGFAAAVGRLSYMSSGPV